MTVAAPSNASNQAASPKATSQAKHRAQTAKTSATVMGDGGGKTASHHAKNTAATADNLHAVKEQANDAMTEHVFIRLPILIGYVRIITALLSFYYMPFAPKLAAGWYVFSSLTDAVDGLSARWLKQESRVGKLFDMLTDRCSTTCLIIVLASFYPKWTFALQTFVIFDICSHWLFVYSAAVHNQSSHKAVEDETMPAVLRLYYSSRPILFLLSAGAELFFIILYAWHFTKGPLLYATKLPLFTVLLCACLPLMVVKVILLGVQMQYALNKISTLDVKETKQKQRKEQQEKSSQSSR